MSILDPATGKRIFEHEKIKEASVQYVVDLLTNNEPEEEFRHEIEIRNMLHETRLKEVVLSDDDEESLSEDDFENVLIKLRKKAPEKYNFLLKGGDSMKRAILKMFQHIYDTERRPTEWLNTRIIQIYKGKGEADDLSNHRNIHTKDYLPKTFETIFVEKSKPTYLPLKVS